MFGAAHFASSTLTVPAGTSTNVQFSISASQAAVPSNLPVFGGSSKSVTMMESHSLSRISVHRIRSTTLYLLIQNASQGTWLPEVYAYNADGSQVSYDISLLKINATNGYGASIPTLQWTRSFRVDVLPANMNITANYYGFDTTVKHGCLPSKNTPSESVSGFPSFGTVVNSIGFI